MRKHTAASSRTVGKALRCIRFSDLTMLLPAVLHDYVSKKNAGPAPAFKSIEYKLILVKPVSGRYSEPSVFYGRFRIARLAVREV